MQPAVPPRPVAMSDATDTSFVSEWFIPDCGDTDSSAARSALKHGAYIPLDHRTFLQLISRWRRTQHESGSASFGINRDKPSVGGVESSRKDRGDVEGDGWIARPAARRSQANAESRKFRFARRSQANAESRKFRYPLLL